MFVAITVLRVPAEVAPALEARFKERSRRVDVHEGFVRLRLLRRRGAPGEYAFVTEWRDREAFGAYMRSRDFATAQAKVPEDLSKAIASEGLSVYESVVDSARGD